MTVALGSVVENGVGLVAAAAAGDEAAFERLIAIHHEDLRRICQVVTGDAEAALSDCFDDPRQPSIATKISRTVLPEPGVQLVEAGFNAIAPDDSIMVIGQGFSIAGEPQLAAIYLATDGSGAYPHFGLPVGFVRSAHHASLFTCGPIATPVPRPSGSATAP